MKVVVVAILLMIAVGLTYNATMYHVAKMCVVNHGWDYAYRHYNCETGY